MNRVEKREFVDTLRGDLKSANLIVVTHQTGLTVSESTDLRSQMRKAGASFKVVKNSLARIVVRDSNLSSLEPYLKGPSALAFSKDPIAAAKVAVEFMEKNPKLTVVGGVSGTNVLNLNDVKTLAKLPSLDELRSKILGVLMAPATQVATLIREPGAQVARVISSYSKQ